LSFRVCSAVSDSIDSRETGRELGHCIASSFPREKLALLVAYSSVFHDQTALLSSIRETVGASVSIVGCSTQGLMTRGYFVEEGYIAGAIGFGGDDCSATTAYVEEICQDPQEKGAMLGRTLMSGCRDGAQVVIMLYDPLCGADVEPLLGGLFAEVRCPIVGGGARQPTGPGSRTFQYFGDRVLSRAAVAAALVGRFTVETDFCHGASPVGVEMIVSRAEGNRILELDGRPAIQVWDELTSIGSLYHRNNEALAIGLPAQDGSSYLIRTATSVAPDGRGVLFQSAPPSGSRIMLHHRTVQGLLGATAEMGRRLRARLDGRTVHAVLGFECGARTKPFLGLDLALEENVQLQKAVAEEAEWLGMLAWGELSPVAGRPACRSFTYSVLVLAE
jgi:hypothetical protein